MSTLTSEAIGSPHVVEAGPPHQSNIIFYPRIEALRGIAALSVAAFHSWQSRWPDAAGQTQSFLSSSAGDSVVQHLCALVLRVLGNGHGAVVLFFVISGFVLTGSLLRGPQNHATGALRFLVARILRIYPAAFATIAIFGVVFWTTGAATNGPDSYDAIGLLKNALLFDTSINGVMWTLQLEVIAVPLLLIAYLGFLRFGVVAVAALFVVLVALSFWGSWTRAIGGANMFGTIHAFVAGMLAFLVSPRLIKWCTPRIATLVLAGAGAGFLASRPVLGWTSNWAVIAEAVFGAIVVAVLAFGRPGALAAMFDICLIRFFGRISYSFYLLHPLTLMVMWNIPTVLATVILAGVPPVAVAVGLFVSSVAVVTPLAFVMYRWVEQPGVRANRKLAGLIGSRRGEPTTTATT
jgi:peptidoglycan/LPS O-acetylase OafA/YrhL